MASERARAHLPNEPHLHLKGAPITPRVSARFTSPAERETAFSLALRLALSFSLSRTHTHTRVCGARFLRTRMSWQAGKGYARVAMEGGKKKVERKRGPGVCVMKVIESEDGRSFWKIFEV